MCFHFMGYEHFSPVAMRLFAIAYNTSVILIDELTPYLVSIIKLKYDFQRNIILNTQITQVTASNKQKSYRSILLLLISFLFVVHISCNLLPIIMYTYIYNLGNLKYMIDCRICILIIHCLVFQALPGKVSNGEKEIEASVNYNRRNLKKIFWKEKISPIEHGRLGPIKRHPI